MDCRQYFSLFYNLEIDKIIRSNKVSFGKKSLKYFTGFKGNKKVKPLCITLPKMSLYQNI